MLPFAYNCISLVSYDYIKSGIMGNQSALWVNLFSQM